MRHCKPTRSFSTGGASCCDALSGALNALALRVAAPVPSSRRSNGGARFERCSRRLRRRQEEHCATPLTQSR